MNTLTHQRSDQYSEPCSDQGAAQARLGGSDEGLAVRGARRAALAVLKRLQHGTLHVTEGEQSWRMGRPSPDGLHASLRVEDPRAWGTVVRRGVLGAGEAFAEGLWTSDDPTAVVQVLLRNRATMTSLDQGWARLPRAVLGIASALAGHGRRRAREDVQAHYDLGDDLFRLFLDPSMTYSSAVFEAGLPPSDLAAAQAAKLERMCRKLDLLPGHDVLEIGCGWGSFGVHAASHHGAQVTGTTISANQLARAKQLATHAGVQDRARFIGTDFRDLTGAYDRVVSIEMIEAIGAANMPAFFRQCADRLRPEGLLGLQAITIADEHYQAAKRRVDFIKRHVFPGSFIPSVSALVAAAAGTDLRLRHMEDLGCHYADTLALWRRAFEARDSEVAALGYPPRFRRLWRYYLAYCEGGFREGVLGVAQMVFAKPRAPTPRFLRAPAPIV